MEAAETRELLARLVQDIRHEGYNALRDTLCHNLANMDGWNTFFAIQHLFAVAQVKVPDYIPYVRYFRSGIGRLANPVASSGGSWGIFTGVPIERALRCVIEDATPITSPFPVFPPSPIKRLRMIHGDGPEYPMFLDLDDSGAGCFGTAGYEAQLTHEWGKPLCITLKLPLGTVHGHIVEIVPAEVKKTVNKVIGFGSAAKFKIGDMVRMARPTNYCHNKARGVLGVVDSVHVSTIYPEQVYLGFAQDLVYYPQEAFDLYVIPIYIARPTKECHGSILRNGWITLGD